MTEEEAKELLWKAIELCKQEELDKAIEILRKIRREDSPKLHTAAQLIIGAMLGEQGNTKEAIAAYRNIAREDYPEVYEQAQFNLGVTLGKQGDTKGEIVAYRNVTREDSPKQYAKARFNLGNILRKQGNIEGAIDAWSNITRKDPSEPHAGAQFNLGLILLEEKKDIEGAINVWRDITHEDSPETYAQAQFNLGIALEKQENTKEAIEAWRNITREDSPEMYAWAQFNLGVTLEKQGYTKESIEAWRNITRKDSSVRYAEAQFNLGDMLRKQENIEGAIDAWSNITRKDSPVLYAKAQSNLGVILLEGKGNIEGAINAWSNITREDFPEAYARAQFYLGVTLEEQGNTERAIVAWRNVIREDLGDIHEENYYEIESVLKLLDHPPFIDQLLKIRGIVATLIHYLLVQKDTQDSKKPKVAHYTDPDAAYKIIAKGSPLRLTSVRGVNDPSEGLVLYQYIQNNYKQKTNTQDLALSTDILNQTTAVFLSCFTFNHDSLNQFRLYGKEEGREASGISLVIDQRFFDNDNLFGIMAANIKSSIEGNIIALDGKLTSDEQNKLNKQPKNKSLDNLPLYRCLYIDPKSGYISIAQRDRATFFAEAWYDKKMADYKTICDQAEKDWDSYLEEISKLTKVVKYEFTQLTEAVFEILQKLQHNGVQKTPSNDMQKSPRDDVLEVLTFILQPLRYLVKHTAFQEEQECRMIYITSLEDTRIKSEWDNKRMYLEYAAPVKDALDKIYLSPGAQPHEDFFKKELPHLAKTGKIRHSQNPFRNK